MRCVYITRRAPTPRAPSCPPRPGSILAAVVRELRPPLLQRLEDRVMCRVRVQRRHRDEPRPDGGDVGHLARLPPVAPLLDPVVGPVAGVEPFQGRAAGGGA